MNAGDRAPDRTIADPAVNEKKDGSDHFLADFGAPLLAMPGVGLEAEFELFVDEERARPEDVFGDPRGFLDVPYVHRTGRSYQLATGGAVYFDTGVLEVATPIIEIEPGCAARVGRSLWETIFLVRESLDSWERRTGRRARLAGFSAHYNVSFEPQGRLRPDPTPEARTVERLAHALSYVLPAPVMLLAANKRSTGVGVRPRGNRVEVTVDFTPSPALAIATAAVVTGVVRSTMAWDRYTAAEAERRGVPVFAGFQPVAHTSRQGWLAKAGCYPRDPFEEHPDDPIWPMTDGRLMTLRQIAWETTRHFMTDIERVGDPITLQLIRRVMQGRAPSLLELEDRPAAYEDVGRLCRWGNLFPTSKVGRSRYERVVTRAISGQRLRIGGRWYVPVGMRGWSHVVFRSERGGARTAFSMDFLVRHLTAWER